ncbi:anion permease [Acinetobacter beijerinckii]|uniref:inorganic phosphate transporter n=1 Tax=Acinetobacter beijerinckii TaxID=262668 RepID=UPI003AF858ED
MEVIVFIAALSVAFSNGANDNFKGFATVWGASLLSYRSALMLATFATLAGSLASLLLSQTLVQQFSGKGLVPDVIVSNLSFIASVACAGAITVFLATRLGFPVSTTHALLGGLIGSGLFYGLGYVNLTQLLNSFLLPMLVSPILAVLLGIVLFKFFRLDTNSNKDCICGPVLKPIGSVEQTHATGSNLVQQPNLTSTIHIDAQESCQNLVTPIHLSISKSLDRLHIGSAIAICFARGLNDTPKLVALLIAAKMLGQSQAVILIAIVMGVGGLLFARKVAQTMSQRITQMDHASGLVANLITAFLVLFASKFGLPVSTTHVAVGAIAGVGASSKRIDWSALRNVLLSWVVTLPFAAGIAWFSMWVFL